ncbi:MAG: 50S ribosomal protein L24 [Flavobacteriales bacterium]|nr:50S ribosomal protein L24 [Flavobacteriales bacterium]MCL4281987.1 50S ribosomal protein L24 [Flavobacteriales bacterium]
MQKKTHIKKGDLVKVLAGEDRAKQGRVLDVDRKHNTALVEGLRINRKHSKPTTATPQGGIVDKEGPIHLSNLMLIDAKTGEPGRVGRRPGKDGKMERFVKSKNKKTAKK